MESMENHNIQELFLNDDVQKLLDNFAGMLDLRVTFFSRFGLPIRRGKEMPNTGFCNFIQQELGLLDKVEKLGWKGLTSRESGRIGGIMGKRKREERKNK